MVNVKENLFNVMCELGYKEYGFTMPFGAGDFYKGFKLLSNERTVSVTVHEDDKTISVKCEVPRNKENDISDNWKLALPRILIKHFGNDWTVIPVKSIIENSEAAVTKMSLDNSEDSLEQILAEIAPEIIIESLYEGKNIEEEYNDDDVRRLVQTDIDRILEEMGLTSLTEIKRRGIVNTVMQSIHTVVGYDPASKTIMKEADPDAEEYEGEEEEFDPVAYEQEHSGSVLGTWSSKFYDDDAEVVTPEIVIEEQKLKGERDTDDEIESPKVSAGELIEVIKDLDISIDEAKDMLESMKDRIVSELGEEGYEELVESLESQIEEQEDEEEEIEDQEELIEEVVETEIEDEDKEDDDFVLGEFDPLDIEDDWMEDGEEDLDDLI